MIFSSTTFSASILTRPITLLNIHVIIIYEGPNCNSYLKFEKNVLVRATGVVQSLELKLSQLIYGLLQSSRQTKSCWRAAWYDTGLSQMRIQLSYKDFVGYVSGDRHLITSCSKFQFLYTKLICIYICLLTEFMTCSFYP